VWRCICEAEHRLVNYVNEVVIVAPLGMQKCDQ
jgi:hypothetical protein